MSEGSTSSTSSSGEGPALTSLPYYDNLRVQNSSSFIREPGNNLDVLMDEDDDGERSLAICHLSVFHSFSYGDGVPVRTNFESALPVALAAHHLNVGDGSIVPQLDGLNDRCKVRFTTEFSDTEYDPGLTLKQVTEQTSRTGLDGNGRPRPCAFIGAARSLESMPMSIITGLQEFVQVSATSTSADLDDKDQFPLFARSIPSDHGTAIPIIRYFREVLNVNHLVVINVNDAYGNAFAEGLRLAAEVHAPGMKIIQVPLDDGTSAIVDVVTRLRESQYRYVFALVFTEAVHDGLLEEAYRQGVAGNGQHNWYFGDTFEVGSLERRSFEEGSPLHLSYRGTGMIAVSGGIPGLPGYDFFMEQITQLAKNQQNMDYLSTVFPKFDGVTPFLNDDGFADPVKDIYVSFMYEAAVLVGLAACEAATRNDLVLTGREHYDRLVQTTFQGVIEDVKLLPETGSRDPSISFFTVTNVVDEEENDGMVKFRGVITDGFTSGNWTRLTNYIQNDGTSNIAPDLPPVEIDMNYASPAVRGTALAFSAVAILLAIGFAYWTYANRMTRVVRASQPFFLHMICVGAGFLALSLIPLSVDHGMASIQGCTIACNSVVWLVSLGCAIIFAALYTKTYRINKILHSAQRFQRIKVEKRDVIKPMMVLLGANLLILALMTGLSPIQFELSVSEVDMFDRTTEVMGSCTLQNEVGYIIALVVVNTGALCCALFQAWQARNLSTEFAESHYIFKALSAVLSIMFVGVPVLIIASDNADARLFVSSAIIFAFAVAILLLMFVPKIHYEKVEKLKSVRNVRLSGIRPSASFVSHGSQLGDDETASSSYLGEKIITTKTAEELAVEVARLQRRLLEAENRADARDATRHQPNGEDSSLEEAKERRNSATVTFCTDSVEPLLEHNTGVGVSDNVEKGRSMTDAPSTTDEGEDVRINNEANLGNILSTASTKGETVNLTGDIESSGNSHQATSPSPIPQATTEMLSSSISHQVMHPKIEVLKKRQEAAAHKFESLQQAMVNRQSEDTLEEGGTDAESS